MKKDWKFTTKAVHIGSEIDETTGAVIPPIYQTSTFAQKSPGEHQGYEYTRSHNPTRTRLENCLASLENTLEDLQACVFLERWNFANNFLSKKKF